MLRWPCEPPLPPAPPIPWHWQELHAAATSDNLKSEGAGAALALFDTSLELWLGRAAMMGIAGLLVLEGVQGKPFF